VLKYNATALLSIHEIMEQDGCTSVSFMTLYHIALSITFALLAQTRSSYKSQTFFWGIFTCSSTTDMVVFIFSSDSALT